MFFWIFSVILYLGTIIAGLYIDNREETKYKIIRRIYVTWLYIFLCFGYMVGSDWRIYESVYRTGVGIERYSSEPASYLLFSYMPLFIPDYWLFAGLVKCLYLYSTYHLISRITDKWISVLALLIPAQLGLMLIQNPFRFMLAVLFVNYALYNIYLFYSQKKGKSVILKIIIFAIIAVLFHNASIIYLLLLPSLLFLKNIYKISNNVVFIIYIIVSIVTSNISYIHELKMAFFFLLQQYMDISDYASYEMDEEESFLSLANISRVFFFILILLSKKTIIKKYENGGFVFSLTIVYFFVSRILFLIPTGFRLALPFVTFCIVFYIFMLYKKKLYALVVITYTLLSFGNKLWTMYDFIPYSNSIPYIVIGHKDYKERFNHNLQEYKARTGKTYYIDKDVAL